MRADTRATDAERIFELIGAIYDCVLEPERWDATLDDIRQSLDCATCALSVVDLGSGAVRIQKIIGIDPDWAVRMADYGADVIKWYYTANFLARPIDEPFSPSRDAQAAMPLDSRFYHEWAKPLGLIDSIAVLLMRSPDRLAEFGLGRHESVGMVTDREVRLLRQLAPHLRRAVTIADLIDMKSLEATSFGSALDTLAAGVLLVTGDGTILHANRAAADMLDRGTPIAAGNSRLRAGDRYATERLHSLITMAAGDETRVGASGIGIALGGRSGETATAHVLPLARGDVRTRLLPRAVAAIFVASDLHLPISSLAAVAEVFGLTPAETRLLERLLHGDSMAEAAAALDIAVTTAKTHRSRLLAKTGTSRQTRLISLVHRLVPAVAAT